MSEIKLYKGNNGIQDFWESEDSSLLIFRFEDNLGNWKNWFVHSQGITLGDTEAIAEYKAADKKVFVMLSDKDIDKLLIKIESQHNIKAVLNKAKHWIDKGKDDTVNMVLEWAYVL